MYWASKRYNILNSAGDRPSSGCPCTSQTVKANKAVRKCIWQDILCKQRSWQDRLMFQFTWCHSSSRIMRAYCWSLGTAWLLTWRSATNSWNGYFTGMRQIARKHLIHRQKYLHSGHSGRKIQQTKQDICQKLSQEGKEKIPRVQRRHHPTSVIVWWSVSHQGATELCFCERGVKTGAKVYQKNVL